MHVTCGVWCVVCSRQREAEERERDQLLSMRFVPSQNGVTNRGGAGILDGELTQNSKLERSHQCALIHFYYTLIISLVFGLLLAGMQ